jgi:serine phosphatase RsbU (regulator of sigma subunit)
VQALYSDGVTEARQRTVEYTDLGLRTLLETVDPLLHIVVDAVISEVLAHTGDELIDDIAVVAPVVT